MFPKFHKANINFMLRFANLIEKISFTNYYLPTVSMKHYNIKLNEIYFFDQSVKNNDKTYESIIQITNGNNNLFFY